MDMTGERRIPAPRQTVWTALNDPAVLQASIPGCESLEKISDHEMKATAAVKIGPISARFTGKVQLLDLDPPTSYRIEGEGQGGVAGFAKGGAVVRLVEEAPNSTLLSYEVKAQVGGKIAQLGARLIDATAKQMADAFFNRFADEVVAPAPMTETATAIPIPPMPAVARISVFDLLPREPGGLPIVFWIGGIIWLLIFILIFGSLSVVLPASVADTAALLAAGGYVADLPLATTVHLALAMQRPLFLEGEPGTGKTEIAKVLASGLERRLVRLQCYDGLDLSAAAYEWDHARQLMAIRIAEAAGVADRQALASDIYAREFLQARPLLSAIDPDLPPAVLLIDELDRADEPFEAFLLEVLGDFQITIPEYGTVHARTKPVVVLTSNRTREVHDAIRRRCLYHWVDYPDARREREILARKAPGVAGKAVGRGGGVRAAAAPRGPVQAARRRRDDRLGGGADASRRARTVARGGGRDAGRAAEVPGRHRQDPRRRGGPAGCGGKSDDGAKEPVRVRLRFSLPLAGEGRGGGSARSEFRAARLLLPASSRKGRRRRKPPLPLWVWAAKRTKAGVRGAVRSEFRPLSLA